MSIYWCEFPEKCNWKNIAEWTKYTRITTYITCSSRKDFEKKRNKIKKVCPNIEINAWPTLSKEEGYWFSGFSSKKSIDKLDQYKGLKIKIDIEPPIPKNYSIKEAYSWLIINAFRKPKNSKYLQNKILNLTKNTDIIVSTFPIPKFIQTNWGIPINNKLKYNYMYYSSFFNPITLFFYNIYYKYIFLNTIKPDYIAIGLIGPGIFYNEPIYKRISELKRDIKFLKQYNLIFFNLESISNKPKEWFETTEFL